jgi:hypothetical protein
MPLLDKRRVFLLSAVLWLAFDGLLSVAGLKIGPPLMAAEPGKLDVGVESDGGVRARAQVLFPAKLEVVQALLSDYQHWPDLFEARMRVADFHVHGDIATVDLRIDHPLMPGERRLVTESRVLPKGGLVTDLTGGDFKRYHRVWKLQPAGEGNQTRADFELVVEIESMVPDWLVAIAMRQELEAHFRIVKQKALEHSKQ